jgi:hypothetical protein
MPAVAAVTAIAAAVSFLMLPGDERWLAFGLFVVAFLVLMVVRSEVRHAAAA